MIPLMRWLHADGAPETQMTHVWNNYHGGFEEFSWLDTEVMVCAQADEAAREIPMALAHMPRFSFGWKQVVVLQPTVPVKSWYVGWLSGKNLGFSYLPVTAQVRLLRGPEPVLFFGLDVDTGRQIPLEQVRQSQIGDDSLGNVPLR